MPTRIPAFRRPTLLVAILGTLLLLVAACGSDDDSEVDAGGSSADSSEPADDGSGDAGSGDGATGGGETRPWIGGEWVLQSAAGPDGPLTLPSGRSIELNIAGPQQVRGGAGCNSFEAVITAPFDDGRDGGALTITDMAITEMACEHLDFEMAYVELLTTAIEWELAPPSGLILRGDGIELVYGIGEPVAPAALEGTTWRFDTIYSGEGVERAASTTRMDLPPVTATVDGGIMALRADGCADVTVAVAYRSGQSEGPFTPEDPDGMAALVDCTDAQSNLTAAVDGVAAATGYQIVEARLTLIGLAGETISFTTADG